MMDIKKKKILIYSFIPVILSVVFIFGFIIASNINQPSTNIEGGIKKVGVVEITVIDGRTGEIKRLPDGSLDTQIVHNLAVDIGLNATRDILGQGTVFGAFNVISVGNASNATSAAAPAAGDTIHSGEYTSNGLSRAAGTYATLQGSVGNWTISNTFTSSGIAGLKTNKTCLFNQTTVAGSRLLACVRFRDVELDGSAGAGDTLLINWTNFVTNG